MVSSIATRSSSIVSSKLPIEASKFLDAKSQNDFIPNEILSNQGRRASPAFGEKRNRNDSALRAKQGKEPSWSVAACRNRLSYRAGKA